MNNCRMCGVFIPDGQEVCSMCYGDPYYGNDGYYLQYLEEIDHQEQERRWGETELQSTVYEKDTEIDMKGE